MNTFINCPDCSNDFLAQSPQIGDLLDCSQCGAPIEIQDYHLGNTSKRPAKTPRTSPAPQINKDQKPSELAQVLKFFLFLGIIYIGLKSCSNSREERRQEELTKPAKENTELSDSPTECKNNPWNGSVFIVKKHLENIAKDPASLKFYDWGKVRKLPNGTFTVWVDYGAKNSFGGMVREKKIFIYDQHGIIE